LRSTFSTSSLVHRRFDPEPDEGQGVEGPHHEEALHYAAPVGEKETYVARAVAAVSPDLTVSAPA
jgi:hypothetical protein